MSGQSWWARLVTWLSNWARSTPTPPAPGSHPVPHAPGEVLDLTHWKLTLPTGAGGHADEISSAALCSGYSNPPWLSVTPDNGVLFRAPVGGATTSGSHYPRCELREMNPAWSSKSGTHTLIVTEAFTHLPNDKPHVVGAQIHDATHDVSVFRLEGNSLYITQGDDTHHHLVTATYQLGTRFEARYVVSGGQVQAYFNGALQAVIDAADLVGAYFKAGVYTQANPTNSTPATDDNCGETVIYALTADHKQA